MFTESDYCVQPSLTRVTLSSLLGGKGSMSQSIPTMDVVRHVYNMTNFDYEVRRLPEESPVEYALTLRWLDRWIVHGAVVADIGVGVGHYALHLAQRACTIHLVDIAERLLHTARARLHDAG